VQYSCVCAALTFLFLFARSYPPAIEDAEGAIKYLRDNTGIEDSLYVHASMVEQFKFYCQRLNCIEPASFYYGSTGWPCCGREGNAAALTNTDDDLHSDLGSFLNYKNARTKWFLFTDRSGHWDYVGRNEPKLIEDILKKLNYEQKIAKRFRGVLVCSFSRKTN